MFLLLTRYVFPVHPVQETVQIIMLVTIGKIKEMVSSQAEQDSGHVFFNIFHALFILRPETDVANELFFTVSVNEQVGDDKYAHTYFLGSHDRALFLLDGSPESYVVIMGGHLPFQFFSGCPDRTQAGKIPPTHVETERIDVPAVRFADEKEMFRVSDRGQCVQLVVILFFRDFPERCTKASVMDMCHLADGVFRYGYQVRVVFPLFQFFQCFVSSVIVVYPVGHGCDATSVEITGIHDKFQTVSFHDSNVL